MFTLKGTLKNVFDTVQLKPTLRKREFIVEYAENPSYPQLLKFDLLQARCSLVDSFQPGDELEVSFSLKGREWVNQRGEKIYIMNLEAFRLERPGKNKPEATPASLAQTRLNNEADPYANDDLPF